MVIEQILSKPVLSEKSNEATEKFNRYTFMVDRRANKNQIKEAVEKLFDVKVLSLKTQIRPGKTKRFGRNVKKLPSSKKAIIEVAEGQSIEFFQGV